MRSITACLTAVTLLGAPASAMARVELARIEVVDPPLAPIELDWQRDRRAQHQRDPVQVDPEAAPAVEPSEPDARPAAEPRPAGEPSEEAESEGGGAATSEPRPVDDRRKVPPPTVAAATAVTAPRLIAVGLGADAPGSREEWALLDRLERGLLASPEPRAELRRLRTPISAPRRVCRETGADYVISVGYVAQRLDPLLAAWDCELDLELGRWAAAEAEEPGLLASIQDEHDEAISTGEAIAGAKGRPKLPPKVRTGLIAGGVVLALGATLAILLVAGLREDRVVLTVRP